MGDFIEGFFPVKENNDLPLPSAFTVLHQAPHAVQRLARATMLTEAIRSAVKKWVHRGRHAPLHKRRKYFVQRVEKRIVMQVWR